MNFEDIEDLNINFETKIYENIEEWKNEEMKNNKNNFNILHVNVRTMSQNKFDLLNIYLNDIIKKIDILVVTEFNCKDEENYHYKIQNFNLNTLSREKRKGGGIAVYTKEKLKITEMKTINFKHAEMFRNRD